MKQKTFTLEKRSKIQNNAMQIPTTQTAANLRVSHATHNTGTDYTFHTDCGAPKHNKTVIFMIVARLLLSS